MGLSFLADINEWFQFLLETFGYLGLFVINLVAAATIILPLPAFFFVFAAGAILNPWLVGLFSAAGAAIGELTSYGLGYGSGKVIETKYEKQMKYAEKLLENNSTFFVIILFAATPLPYDVIGILMGAAQYDIRKFILATFIGKLIMMTLLAWAGFFGWNTILGYMG